MVVIVDCVRGKQRYENLRLVVGFVGSDGGGGWLFFQVVVIAGSGSASGYGCCG